MKIGILGSACDPPHNAHKLIGEYARKIVGLDKIFLVPTFLPPHKKASSVRAEDRLRMARLFVQDLPHWEALDVEIQRGGISYTKDTLQELRAMYPQDTLYMIIGLDNLLDMPRAWKGGYDTLDKYTFVVAARPGYSWEEVPSSVRKKIILLELEIEDSFHSPISSTMIRELRKKDKPINAYVPHAVSDFIYEKKLYQ